ncbi:hypothetical protein MP228_000964 [Amoeboaphelidium protococcarum]|nr:hypothetical protein MP228_000964 [Amoeboaphelidium protococcarum]
MTYQERSQQYNWQSAFKASSDITLPIKNHLVRVYSSLAAAIASCALGVYLNVAINLWSPGILTMIASFALIFGIKSLAATRENQNLRFAMLLGFGLLQGLAIGPLLHMVIFIDEKIVLHAVVCTALVFIGFTGVALNAKRRSYLYLGGILASGMSILMWTSLFNMFVRSKMLYTGELYLGLLVFMGYVIFDTQIIIEKAAQGSRDFIGHSVELFADLIAMFIRILIIMLKNNENKRRQSNDNNRKRK